MSVNTFLKSVELDAAKVAGFVVKEMTAAENALGAKTGSAKANLVISAVEGALDIFGVPVATAQAELKTATDALTALFNKLGLFTSTSATPPASS